MKPFNTEDIKRLRAAIDEQEGTIVVVPHVNPDGDAIGSVLGLSRILKNAGKQVVVISPNHFPEFLKWMNGSGELVVYVNAREKAAQIIDDANMLICLDFNHLSRTGEMKDRVENWKGKSIMIDHHPFPQGFADLQFSHPDYSSTAELVFHITKAMGYEKYIDQDAAECLFCGIMTDTGSFNYNVSDPQTFKTVSELLAFGVNPEDIHGRVFDNYSVDRMQLMGHCLSECMEVFPEYNAAVMYLSRETQNRFKYQKGDNEGFVNMPLSIKGIHFSAFFTENDNQIKASFRSKGEFAVNEFATAHFNGGGHRNAAGGEVYSSLHETIERFRKLLPEYKEELNRTQLD
ncbi:DHH family phosphoesterase [Mangrovibacterium lignilyticum]|uniref:DHH family phosphoesterase n=1 Tax=Mangrovibacterium lignilyticum TaxID=2668052 RepID=UPI0013D823AE|nr:bifunctional oligoribonuclease/PAP phosphatase NrnA [Mangrovibacterium lignilyticum]